MVNEKELKIPKKIHYCWFGTTKKSSLIIACIDSWKKCLPDYEIIEWNETNTDLSHPFVIQALALKKWAFVSDYVRLKVLFDDGGVYLDTDMMVVKSFSDLLDASCFFGAEETTIVSGGIIGAIKQHAFIETCLLEYDRLVIEANTNLNTLAIPLLLTKVYTEKYGKPSFEHVIVKENLVVYPASYFYPLPNAKKDDAKNYEKYSDATTYAIHLWNASWVTYDEFHYLRKKKYGKAIVKIFSTLVIKRDFDLYYFKRLYFNFRQVYK